MDACVIFSLTPSDPIGPCPNINGNKNVHSVVKKADGHFVITVNVIPRGICRLAAFITESTPGFGFTKPPQVYQEGLTNKVHVYYGVEQQEDVTLTVGVDLVANLDTV